MNWKKIIKKNEYLQYVANKYCNYLYTVYKRASFTNTLYYIFPTFSSLFEIIPIISDKSNGISTQIYNPKSHERSLLSSSTSDEFKSSAKIVQRERREKSVSVGSGKIYIYIYICTALCISQSEREREESGRLWQTRRLLTREKKVIRVILSLVNVISREFLSLLICRLSRIVIQPNRDSSTRASVCSASALRIPLIVVIFDSCARWHFLVAAHRNRDATITLGAVDIWKIVHGKISRAVAAVVVAAISPFCSLFIEEVGYLQNQSWK